MIGNEKYRGKYLSFTKYLWSSDYERLYTPIHIRVYILDKKKRIQPALPVANYQVVIKSLFLTKSYYNFYHGADQYSKKQ